jgi:hypothetical protein
MIKFLSNIRTELNIDNCFKIIRKYAWINNSNYPLILYLNINTNNRLVLSKLSQSLNNIFFGKFINKKYGFSGRGGFFPFGQIPIKELMGNISIITNKYPIIGSLDEFINGTVNSNYKYISEIQYSPSTQLFGGIISKRSNISELINNNMFNITIIDSIKNNDINIKYSGECLFVQNFRNPKTDIFNADSEDCQKLGCQIILMNYQLFDENMKKYYDFFKNSSLVLKPEKLRYIEKPKPILSNQNIKASYEPRNISVKGWYNYNI